MKVQRCLYCGGDGSAPDHLKTCDGRQGKVDAYDGISSTGEYFDVMNATNSEWIAFTRRVAEAEILASPTRTTTTEDVLKKIAPSLPPGKSARFMGAVFRCKQFRWTGEWYVFENPRHHGLRVKVWTLA